MTPKVIIAATVEPLTLDECRSHLEAQRYDDTTVDDADDAMIAGLLAAAREHCENFCGLSLATRTLEVAFDAWPTRAANGTTAVVLPMGPVREIVEFTVGEPDSSSDDTTVDPDAYVLDTHSMPARLVPVTTWPAATAATNTIRISYLAGYGVDSDGGEALPAALRSAILLVLGHLFKHREDTAAMALAHIPLGAEALMRPLRIRLGMA